MSAGNRDQPQQKCFLLRVWFRQDVEAVIEVVEALCQLERMLATAAGSVEEMASSAASSHWLAR